MCGCQVYLPNLWDKIGKQLVTFLDNNCDSGLTIFDS